MKALIDGRPRILAVVAAAALLAVVAWVMLASGPAEQASSDQVGIEVTFPRGVATLEGELRQP